MPTDPNEAALDHRDMERLRNGHDAALNDLMERHAQRLFHYLLRQLHNESDAEDVAQEAFARVFQHRSRFKPSHRFSTWLYTIATNLARNRHRQRTRHPHVSLEAGNEPGGGELKSLLADTAATPGEQLDTEERAAAVKTAIAQLPDELRSAILLFEYEDLSHQEISEVLGCTPKAVEMRLYHGRRQLRERLAHLL